MKKEKTPKCDICGVELHEGNIGLMRHLDNGETVFRCSDCHRVMIYLKKKRKGEIVETKHVKKLR